MTAGSSKDRSADEDIRIIEESGATTLAKHEKAPGRQLETDNKSHEKFLKNLNNLLENNQLAEALPILNTLADQSPDDPQLRVTAGLVALSLDKQDEASRSFELALKADPKNIDALYNSALLAMSRGMPDRAIEHFETIASVNPEDSDVYNDLAVIWINKSNIDKVKECFARAIELNPNYTQARKNAMEFAAEHNQQKWGRELLDQNRALPGVSEETVMDIDSWENKITPESSENPTVTIRTGKAVLSDRITAKKIAIFANHKAFVIDIIKRLEEDDNQITEYSADSGQSMSELLSSVDLAWFEWCDNLVIEASRLPKTCPIICRLHSYEAFTEMPSQVNWENVDHLIFVNKSVMELVGEQSASIVAKTVIHNGVDIDRFIIPENKTYGKKIASVGYINYKKNPALLLYCFKKIYEYDSEFTFHVAGLHQDPRIKLYFDNFLKESPLPIEFCGWVTDMPQWYQDKDYVISTFLFESFHYSIAEGMASGLMPLIHNWYGAKHLYPEEHLYADPDACLELIKEFEKNDRCKQAQINRKFISNRYNLDDKFGQISRLMNKVVIEHSRKVVAV